MPCQVDISASDEAKHFEKLLCLACRYLTAEQIDSLQNPGSGIYDGMMWYTQHLFLDACHSESSYSERHIATHELHRLGYAIRDAYSVDGSGKVVGQELVKL